MTDNQAISRLALNNVYLRYANLPVLENLSLTVNAGEFVVLIGPSGCGKTTILNILSGYLKPQSGAVVRNGIVRTVYQRDGLFPWLTVKENIMMGLRGVQDHQRREQELAELMGLIHLQGFESNYPHQLSGGMRQRVELARVMAGESDILLMDEPFSALDYQTRLRMRHELILLLQKKPRTTVFVTHDIEEAVQLADRVLVLSNRPSYICRELSIESVRPRSLTDEKTIEATNALLYELGLSVIK